jgi:hypothetical protein
VSGERSAPAGRFAAFERRLANLSPGARVELEFRWTISRLWRRGPVALSEFLGLFLTSRELRQPFEAAVDAYLDAAPGGKRARATARNRRAAQRWRQRQRAKAQAPSTTPARGGGLRASPPSMQQGGEDQQ